jgi:hypothetical protein
MGEKKFGLMANGGPPDPRDPGKIGWFFEAEGIRKVEISNLRSCANR